MIPIIVGWVVSVGIPLGIFQTLQKFSNRGLIAIVGKLVNYPASARFCILTRKPCA